MVTPFARGAILRRGRQARFVPIEHLTGSRGVVVLTPHPDDESLGCGGAIAAASAAGRAVVVVALTDGGLSHPHSRLYSPERLVSLREAELRQAVARLTDGAGTVIPLGYADQGVPCGADGLDRAMRLLLSVCASDAISAIWTTWDGDPHPDHQAAAGLARQLITARPDLALWRFPVWGRFIDRPPDAQECLVRFDTARHRRAKEQAVMAHRSQMTRLIADDPDGFVMDRHTRRHFVSSPELFIGQGGS